MKQGGGTRRVLRAGTVIAAMFLVLGCRGDKRPTASAKEAQLEDHDHSQSSSDEPLALQLFRSGIEEQCKAAAVKTVEFVNRIKPAHGYHAKALPKAEELTRACVERNQGRSLADDIVIALDIDPDKLAARAAEIDTGLIGAERGRSMEDALVEAILATDKRLANVSDRSTFCFVAALRLAVFIEQRRVRPFVGRPASAKLFDDCTSGATLDAGERKFLDCVVAAQRRSHAIDCWAARKGGYEHATDLLTGEGESSADESDRSKQPDLGDERR